MRIRRLDICGFKSFMDRMTFVFDDGITGVVGPNGCGKSNVVDAIRWVMGEQSAKHLRGHAMSDVIFNGSEHHAPLGMSEVSLTFLNDDDKLTLPVGLQRFFTEYTTNWPGLMAASFIMSVPVVVMFLVLQKYFVKALTEGAVKS